MILFRRLSLLLLALALLPGMSLQARVALATPVATTHAQPAQAMDGCHEATMPLADGAAHAAPAANAGGTSDPHAGCCGDALSHPGGCGDGCTCPAATATLPLSAAVSAAVAPERLRGAFAWHPREDIADAPPRRPPIA